jgi:hypothetical protein
MERDWQRLTRPGFKVELSYPVTTPQGHVVERADDERGDTQRVHLTSPGSTELYVELMRFGGTSPRDEYLQHRPHLEQRFGAGSVTELSETSLRGRAAWAYAFRWGEGERSVLLFDVDGDTYRVIHDPRSALNADVIATLEVVE